MTIGYVLKVYPRFSETFVVTEMLAREAQGEKLRIYALRPTTDTRFQPEIARVTAPVTWIPRPRSGEGLWSQVAAALDSATIRARFQEALPALMTLPGDEVAQALHLAAAIERDGITHIHAHFASLAGRMAWAASRLTGVPFTVTTHAKDLYHESVDPLWLRRICLDADRVIAISRFNESYLNKTLSGTGARVSLRYNALELDRFPYRPAQPDATRPLRIGAVGRLVPKKGFDVLLEAVAALRDAGVQTELRIAGDGDERDALAHRISELGLDNVQLLGPLPQDSVKELLYTSDVLAVPCIHAADGNLDGLPTVILEAMACGTPVVASDISAISEVVRPGSTGVLVPPGDIAALAKGLTSVSTGARQLTDGARALIEESFDSRRQAAQLRDWEEARP